MHLLYVCVHENPLAEEEAEMQNKTRFMIDDVNKDIWGSFDVSVKSYF